MLFDPWCFDVPLAFKPGIFNNDFIVNSLNLSDLIHGSNWDFNKLRLLFGDYASNVLANLSSIDTTAPNHWVLSPWASNSNLATNVYSTLNRNLLSPNHWSGWKRLWSLRTAPRVKHFLWLLFKDRLSTFEYLYSINLGPRNFCPFFGLHFDSIEHLFLTCYKTQGVWSHAESLFGKRFNFSGGFIAGNWLANFGGNTFVKSMIAAVAWHLWKARCDLIFRNIQPNFEVVTLKAYCFAKCHSRPHTMYSGQRFLLNNFTATNGLFLFITTSYCSFTQVYHAGFFCTSATYNIIFAGPCPVTSSTCLEAELLALSHALQFVLSNSLSVHHIFSSNSDFQNVLHSSDHTCSWHLQHLITSSLTLLAAAGSPHVFKIPRIWIGPVLKLAAHAANLHTITLFLVGRDLPKRIMRSFSANGFSF